MAMVKAFHETGLKVYVDVVYNHHDEGQCRKCQRHYCGDLFIAGLNNEVYFEALNPAQTNLCEK